MALETDRIKYGLLDRQRIQYLRDATDEQKRTQRGQIDSDRIRKEIYHGLLDFTVIAAELEEQERRALFEQIPENRELQRGIESTLAFLYRGLDGTEQDFEDVLAAGLQRPEEGLLQGRISRNGTDGAILELEPRFLDVSKEPEEYTDPEIGALLFSGQIDGDRAFELLEARREARTED
jgi:hypothetical protein